MTLQRPHTAGETETEEVRSSRGFSCSARRVNVELWGGQSAARLPPVSPSLDLPLSCSVYSICEGSVSGARLIKAAIAVSLPG